MGAKADGNFEVWVMENGKRDYYYSCAKYLRSAKSDAAFAAEHTGLTMAVFDVRPRSAVFVAKPPRKKAKT